MRQGKTDGGRRGIRIFLGLAAGAAAVAVLITAGLHLLGEYQERQKRRAYPYPEEYAALIARASHKRLGRKTAVLTGVAAFVLAVVAVILLARTAMPL